MANCVKIKTGILISILFLLCVQATEGQCNTTKNTSFGPDCQFLCHCIKNEQCDSVTGNCSSGCDFDWVGPSCQRRNIILFENGIGDLNAKRVVTRHASNTQLVQRTSELAVDRNLSTCSYTNYANISNVRPWWRVWLNNSHTIRNIMIITEEQSLECFKEFTVLVENVTFSDRLTDGVESNIICYEQGSSTPKSRTIYVKCNHTILGNQVRIKLFSKNTQLVLCDVRIYGECENGLFGETCTEKCSPNCMRCDEKNGSCKTCKPGWTGNHCIQECDDGKHGLNCKKDCSGHCKNVTPCNKTDGSCEHGCSPGYTGNLCDLKCKYGTYGTECAFNCSRHCLNSSTCMHTNGSCLHGCDPGWTVDTCNEECQNYTYGYQCISNCSRNCKDNEICNKTNGYCSMGCKRGWQGNTCTEECHGGTYGADCAFNCSEHCSNGSACIHTNGSCLYGCDVGWKGETCDEGCNGGTYGADCAYNCSEHCSNGSACIHTNGSCLYGCDVGWKRETCDEGCNEGTYGAECAFNCSEHCSNGSACIHTNGSCLYGCDVGWKRETCDEECHGGTYGADCAFNCSEHCSNGSACIHTNGSCLYGCDVGWKGETCDEETDAYTGSEHVTVAVSAGFLVLVVTAVVAVSCWKRKTLINRWHSMRRRYQRHGCEETSFDNIVYQSTRAETDIYAAIRISQESTEYCNSMPIRRSPHAISVSDICTVVKEKCSIKGYFASLFETIPTGSIHPTSVAEKPENTDKNRFRKILPYDHSRVILKTLAGQPYSDFINANFIAGQVKENAYIASQGPVKENVDDFWRMVWEFDIRSIVVVTKLTELGKMKCMKYWGEENEIMQFGQINVTMQLEEVYAEFTLRTFIVFHQNDVKTEREVTQYHYTAWPDKDIPKTASGLLHFWRKVRQHDETKEHTWLVHCSAGIGRTGTFLAMDILYDQGKNLGFIDVYQCVRDLRDQRVNMVQTQNQYMYLHMLMLEVFGIPSRPISVDDFTKEFIHLQQRDKRSAKSTLLIEYETLDDAFTLRREMNAVREGEIHEVSTAIDSADEFRPVLSTFVPGSPNLIEAAYVPSYFNLHGYIIAQYPLEYTKMEICRLVFEKRISLVVTFPYSKNSAHKSRQILFEEMTQQTNEFVVLYQSQTERDDYSIKEYVLVHQNMKHCFKEIIYKCWSCNHLTSLTPDTAGSFLNMLGEVDLQIQHQEINLINPILIQCWNGVERSGLAAVVMNMLNRARLDNEVSIPQVIRQLRHIKPDIIPNFGQYRFCYEVLNSHLESNATYGNV